MRLPILFFAFLVQMPFSTGCGRQESHNQIYAQADSLLSLTLILQSRIGSPEIQRIHDFQAVINKDINILADVKSNDTSLLLYRELQIGLEKCMQACNQFHEEAYLLEISLRDIMKQTGEKGANLKYLEEKLLYERDNYNDLYTRTDSSLIKAIQQAGIFYQLKPEIDRIMEHSEKP